MEHRFGAHLSMTGVEFKVWAPVARSASVMIFDRANTRVREIRMTPCDEGVFIANASDLQVGAWYKFALDDLGEYPDPYSRYQPQGPQGPSMVVDTRAYRWRDRDWNGVALKGQVVYELHIGAFTKDGTFDSAREKLNYLRELGVTLVEIMPVAEFPGKRNWGYDGVNLFAPSHLYGDYDALKRFVDEAHQLNLGVILDVVYNHIGPDGNYLPRFSPHYFSTIHNNEWGAPFNVDGENSAYVRQFILDNACEWIREFHLDGLRLDATSNIPDDSATHILQELCAKARASAGHRDILIIAEDEQQHGSRLRDGTTHGFGIDALWNDDFHHSAHVALTGRRHAYFYDYLGTPQEFISSIKHGCLFQGQYYHWQKKNRGERFHTWAPSCVVFLDNHDQVANSLSGSRLHTLTSAARYRAMMALLLLAPQTPLLFMGQEFNATTPFLFFADHVGELRDAVRRGRYEFLSQFPSISTGEGRTALGDPMDESAFKRSKLCWEDRDPQALQLTIDLLGLRKSDSVICQQNAKCIDGAVLSERGFLLRWFDAEHGDRLLVVNLSTDWWLQPGPEPLLAPSINCSWSMLWSSERVAYGGVGAEHPDTDRGWYLPGETATLLREIESR